MLCIWKGGSRFVSQFNFLIRQKAIALTFNCKENTDSVCVCVCVYQFSREIGLWKSSVFQVSIEKSITDFYDITRLIFIHGLWVSHRNSVILVTLAEAIKCQ